MGRLQEDYESIRVYISILESSIFEVSHYTTTIVAQLLQTD